MFLAALGLCCREIAQASVGVARADLCAREILVTGPGIELASTTVAGRFLTTGPPGKCLTSDLYPTSSPSGHDITEPSRDSQASLEKEHDPQTHFPAPPWREEAGVGETTIIVLCLPRRGNGLASTTGSVANPRLGK